GFLRSDEAWIDRVANQIPLLLEANFSLGAHWLGRALSAAGRLPPGFDLSILEAHRRGKRDRPSGTAREIARRIGPLRPLPTAEVDAAAPEDPGEIEIASLRTGEIPGVHQIWVSGPHELLRIEHLVLDRAAFAGGMLWAAMRLWERKGELPARRYYLDELLDTEATP
ncbi:MAG: dihydrodipicolinate reductase C-terminal domain-containing protein, partial [Thermoplasmata archaeon]